MDQRDRSRSLMATTTTNFGWDIPQSTDLVKDGATAIAALGQDIDTAMVDLKGGTTGQVLAKASGTDLDFSWVAIDPLVILDAKGDLITATAADTPARLAVGTNGQVLTADSTAATGLKWETAASGGMTLLSTTTLSSTSTTISGISGSYKNLQIAIFGINHSTSGQNITLQFNSVTSGYFGTTTDDSSTAATRTSNASAIPVLFGNGYGTGGENLTNINIPFYSKASIRKPIEIQTVYKTDDVTRVTGATNGVYGSANTSAISSITILSSATPTAGTVEIYGIN